MTIKGCRILEYFPGIYHIETPGNTFVTLLTGCDTALLVDTGLGICDLKATVEEITSLPLTVVNSHGHSDHIGGNYQFKAVQMCMEDVECAEVAMLDEIKQNVIAFNSPSVNTDRYLSYHLENIVPLDADRPICLGGISVIPIRMPTHTPGSVGFYVPKYELLLGGDSVCPFLSLFFPEASDIESHIALMDRLETLPLKAILCSHSESIFDRSLLKKQKNCGLAYDESKTSRYKDTYFPRYKGRLFTYSEPENPSDFVFLVSRPH